MLFLYVYEDVLVYFPGGVVYFHTAKYTIALLLLLIAFCCLLSPLYQKIKDLIHFSFLSALMDLNMKDVGK